MKVSMIAVTTRPTSAVALMFRHMMIWSFLVGAEAASHLLFGGSWVIDVVVLTALIGFIFHLSQRATGASVQMAKPEISAWVTAGMPDDIELWRRARRATVI